MIDGLAVLAVLPLALLNWRRNWSPSDANWVQFIPMIASAVGSIIKHKQQKSAEKKQLSYEQKQAEAAEAARRTEYEAAQNSPSALAQRQKFTLQLGKLLGAAGGREKLPPSILNYLESQRKTQAYTPGATYIPRPESGAGGWDLAAGITNALQYYDPGAGKVPTSVGQPVGGGLGGGAYQTGQLSQLLRPKNPNFASGTRDFG